MVQTIIACLDYCHSLLTGLTSSALVSPVFSQHSNHSDPFKYHLGSPFFAQKSSLSVSEQRLYSVPQDTPWCGFSISVSLTSSLTYFSLDLTALAIVSYLPFLIWPSKFLSLGHFPCFLCLKHFKMKYLYDSLIFLHVYWFFALCQSWTAYIKMEPFNAGDTRDMGLITRFERSPGEGTLSIVLGQEIPWTEKPGVLQSKGLQRVGHSWALLQFISHFCFVFLHSTFHHLALFCCVCHTSSVRVGPLYFFTADPQV